MADSNKCLGSCVFFWGQKQEKTPTWFSMFSKKGKPTEAVQIMEKLWKGKESKNQFPKIDYMLVNQKGAKDDIFVKAGEICHAEVIFSEPENEKVEFFREILPDLLEEKGGGEKETTPYPIENIIMENNNKNITFKAPENEGAYRLYIYISDPSGQTAISNTPFFVVNDGYLNE
jgi:hypothetical protein